MTTLTDLKAIAARRTPGEWGYYDSDEPRESNIGSGYEFIDTIIHRDSGVYGPEENDAEFILMAAANIDKLIAVAEAAKKHLTAKNANQANTWDNLRDAIAALEAE